MRILWTRLDLLVQQGLQKPDRPHNNLGPRCMLPTGAGPLDCPRFCQDGERYVKDG